MLEYGIDLPKMTPEQFFVSVQFLMVMILSFYYILPGAHTDASQHKNWKKFSNLVIATVNFIVQYLPAVSALLLENPSSSTYFSLSVSLFILGSGIASMSNCDRSTYGSVENTLLSQNSSFGILYTGVNAQRCNKMQLSTFMFGHALKHTAVSTAFGGLIAYYREMY
jgi:hypothetical protein